VSKPSYYSIIPANVRYDNELKANEKLLYGEITALANKNGFCYANNKYFARLYDVTTSTISRWISNLKSRGYVRVKINKDDGNERQIFLNNSRGIDENRKTPLEENVNTPIDENRKHNNINKIFNNTSNNNNNNNYNMSAEEKKILKVLQQVENYPFEFEKDLDFVREKMEDFPDVDFLQEIKKWKTYKLDNPLKKKSNPRLQIHTWINNASEGRYSNNNSKNKDNPQRHVKVVN
jgi:DNA-binding MarR family transcriptional regulator